MRLGNKTVRTIKIVGIIFLGLIIVGPVTGLVYQSIGSVQDAEIRRTPPGRLIDVNGQKLHIDCRGFGAKTLVLEAGGLSFSANWALIQPVLARQHRVCSYDRPGLGWSESAEPAESLSAWRSTLFTLLNSAGEHGPYVLIGHSIGGALIREYAAQDQSNISGLVFIDSGPPGPYSSMSKTMREHFEAAEQSSRLMPTLARFGFLRFKFRDLNLGDDFPHKEKEVIKAFFANVRHIDVGAREFRLANDIEYAGQNLSQMTIPILAIIGRYDHNDVEGHVELGLAYHRELADLSVQNGRFLNIEGASHADLLGTEHYADQVVTAINAFIAGTDEH